VIRFGGLLPILSRPTNRPSRMRTLVLRVRPFTRAAMMTRPVALDGFIRPPITSTRPRRRVLTRAIRVARRVVVGSEVSGVGVGVATGAGVGVAEGVTGGPGFAGAAVTTTSFDSTQSD
jgi:hypothetical protein